MAYTTAKLLNAIERRSFSPENQATFTEAEILATADEVLKSDIIPAILNTREEFFVTSKDYSILAGVAAYDLPARAISIREIQIVNAEGDVVRNLVKIRPEDVYSYSAGSIEAFYLRNNQVILFRTPATTANTLRIFYTIDLGDLVPVSASAIISAIDTVTNVVSVSVIPSTWVTGMAFDFIRKDGNHEYKGNDFSASLVSGSDITFASLPSNLAIGDYINISGESSLVQLPPNFRPTLATLAAAEILMSQSQPGGKEQYDKGLKMLERAQTVITPRVEGELDVIMPSWD